MQVSGLTSGVTAVSINSNEGMCAIVSGGVKCWGYNNYGQLGDGTNNETHIPVDVVGMSSNVTALTSTGYHTCAIQGGAVKCWGYNNYGQLGTSGSNSNVPITAVASGATAVAAFGERTCAIVSDGLKCWGNNVSGSFGDGTTTNYSTPTTAFGLTSGVSKVYIATDNICVVLDTGAVKCAGYNNGRLGNGSGSNSTNPVTTFASGVSYLGWWAGGANEAAKCGVLTTGGVKCWGPISYNGEIGDGSTTGARISPSQVIGITSGVTQLAVGDSFACAVVSGVIKCWGSRSFLDPYLVESWTSPQAVDFTCPTNYVLVPAYSDSDITVPEFCVMKFEASSASGAATSQPYGTPWVNIARGASSSTAGSAWKACKDLGSGYDLISNAQWQSIARQIEDATDPGLTAPNNYRNWSNYSKSGSNFMNRGHSDNNPSSVLDSYVDNNPCQGTNENSCNYRNNNDFLQKRTHILPNGRSIWDFAGNVTEWVKDDSTFNYGVNEFWALVGSSYGNACFTSNGCNGPQGKPKAAFGPAGDYSAKTTGEKGALGHGWFGYTNGAILRGGQFGNDTAGHAGVFTVAVDVAATASWDRIGFRCVYTP